MSSIAASPGVADLPDGADVMIGADEDDELSAEDLADLAAGVAEIDRGEYITSEELNRRLDERAARLASQQP